jgi:hypothetical protein
MILAWEELVGPTGADRCSASTLTMPGNRKMSYGDEKPSQRSVLPPLNIGFEPQKSSIKDGINKVVAVKTKWPSPVMRVF